MKYIYLLLGWLGFMSLSFAQELRASKEKFSEFPKECKVVAKYKMLEIRYIVIKNDEYLDSLIVQNNSYKFFQTRNQAIEYYYAIRHIARKQEVYYIASLHEKATEYFPFEEK